MKLSLVAFRNTRTTESSASHHGSSFQKYNSMYVLYSLRIKLNMYRTHRERERGGRLTLRLAVVAVAVDGPRVFSHARQLSGHRLRYSSRFRDVAARNCVRQRENWTGRSFVVVNQNQAGGCRRIYVVDRLPYNDMACGVTGARGLLRCVSIKVAAGCGVWCHQHY